MNGLFQPMNGQMWFFCRRQKVVLYGQTVFIKTLIEREVSLTTDILLPQSALMAHFIP